ncbi:DUF2357 domain-containing protein [Pseudomonas coronafaciens]|uniref:DUF2357 domain-containing protein n=1 Tax=Pseudomonas coronafaciens TaxID=53409 RepID=UPI000E3ED410|nr:DUF2357 domain-containing protein [Pseudomonas coronafaciens]
MAAFLRVLTTSWELSISARGMSDAIGRYYQISFRDGAFGPPRPYVLRLQLNSAPLEVEAFGVAVEVTEVSERCNFVLRLPLPFFFENYHYNFEWVFRSGQVSNAIVASDLVKVNDGFTFLLGRAGYPARLVGSVLTGNDLGWSRLPVVVYKNDIVYEKLVLEFEVLSTKLDVRTDLMSMYALIDSEFPLWRFSIAERTRQGGKSTAATTVFPLVWLVRFQELLRKVEAGFKTIINSPHRQLTRSVRFRTAEGMRSRVSDKVAEKISEHQLEGMEHKRYGDSSYALQVNTPENRFVKYILLAWLDMLSGFACKIALVNNQSGRDRLSSFFIDEIDAAVAKLRYFSKKKIWGAVGRFEGRINDSLVLHQKTGYSAIYHSWQELKYLMNALADDPSISVKPISEVYEIWCFLVVRQILVSDLGFKQSTNSSFKMITNSFLEVKLVDGMAGAFTFYRDDGVVARLAHEPVFRNVKAHIRSYSQTQKPDIVLEVTFPDKCHMLWIFDAKYRVQNSGRFDTDGASAVDYVPEDAINQMHRYRDALFATYDLSGMPQRARPVFGAFALYPGHFNQSVDVNPYAESISQINIGAFALAPSGDQSGVNRKWLTDFLLDKVGPGSFEGFSESLMLHRSVRIPPTGLSLSFYENLTLVIPFETCLLREVVCSEPFSQKLVLPGTTVYERIKYGALNEVKFVGFSILNEYLAMEIRELWQVKKILVLSEFDELPSEFSHLVFDDFIFYLDSPMKLPGVVSVDVNSVCNSVKLTTISDVHKSTFFSEISELYKAS